MRLLVCGDRHWTNFKAILREIKARYPEVVIEGGAPGADTMAFHAAQILGIPVLEFPAEWDKLGRSAGPIRNRQMIDEGEPDEVIAFHANISASKGTKNMIMQAEKKGIPWTIFEE